MRSMLHRFAVMLLALAMLVSCAGIASAEAAKDTVNIGVASGSVYLDASFLSRTNDFTIMYNVYEPLFNKDENNEAYPCLATGYEMVDDNTWRITLREGVTFTSGTPFNAEAVVRTFERSFKLKEMGIWSQRFHDDICYDGIEVVDDYTILFHTTAPTPNLLTDLYAFGIMDPTMIVDENGEIITDELTDLSQVSGTGPYVLTSFVRDGDASLVANENYWGEAPAIKNVNYRVIADESTRVAELITGGVDLIQNPSVDQLDMATTDTTEVVVAPARRDCALTINLEKELFQDVRVRQAVNYAVNKEEINAALMGGDAEIYSGFMMPPHEADVGYYTYDPDMARSLLAEAGVPEGTHITLVTTTGRYVREADVSQVIAGYLDDIGFDTEVQIVDYSVWAEKRSSSDYDLCFIALGGYTTGVGEAMWLQDSVSENGWSNTEKGQEFDALYEEAKTEMDPEQYQEILNEMQQLVFDDCPWLFLYRQPSFYAKNKDLNWVPRVDESMPAQFISWN